ncbi:MAG: DNA/RNA nuclease SfsA, partial [Candidatus Cloacimonetes bacterium]|nr:DNA/RNA nuclease SfsA [Candidatus Cloacimonadota bacterium]
PNRFVMELKLHGKPVQAYIPNTGRLSEFMIPGQKFYLTRRQLPKFKYQVIGSEYQGHYVFLDTVKINRIFYKLLTEGCLTEFGSNLKVSSEIRLGSSRYDFLLTNLDKTRTIIEVKSCTLCHDGIAMFPDAPTARGSRHLSGLEQLALQGYRVYNVFLICHETAERFRPNCHTDPVYCRTLLKSPSIFLKAFSLKFRDPVTVDLQQTREVPVELPVQTVQELDRGSYLLVLKNFTDQEIAIGKMGKIRFPEGYYIYAGSALNGLEKRIKRHQRLQKKQHWHIDYLIPHHMQVIGILPVKNPKPLEQELAEEIAQIARDSVKGFGAGDSKLDSHLFYFADSPIRISRFWDIVLKYRNRR